MVSAVSRVLDFLAQVGEVVVIGRELENGRITPDQARRAIVRLGQEDDRRKQAAEETAPTGRPTSRPAATVQQEDLVA